MPTDATATEYRSDLGVAEVQNADDRAVPAGAGIALGVIAGTVMWGGILWLVIRLF